MVIADGRRTGLHIETVLLHKTSAGIKTVGIKSHEELYEVAIKAGSDIANIAAAIKYKP